MSNSLTALECQILNSLQTNSWKAITRKTKKFGHRNFYRPKQALMLRISREFNISQEEAYNTLITIHKKLTS